MKRKKPRFLQKKRVVPANFAPKITVHAADEVKMEQQIIIDWSHGGLFIGFGVTDEQADRIIKDNETNDI